MPRPQIIGHHRLLEVRLQRLTEQAAASVYNATGRIRKNELDRAIRIALSVGRYREQVEHKTAKQEGHRLRNFTHFCSLICDFTIKPSRPAVDNVGQKSATLHDIRDLTL